VRIAKNFGDNAQRTKEQNRITRLWELVEVDYDVLRQESKVEHPRTEETLVRLIEELEELKELLF